MQINPYVEHAAVFEDGRRAAARLRYYERGDQILKLAALNPYSDDDTRAAVWIDGALSEVLANS